MILAGDSAGGHLATGVALLSVIRGFRRPDGLILHYPCLSTEARFFPSNLLCLDDAILS